MIYPKVLYQFKQCAGQTFRPSNGTEGMIFTDAFCMNCLHCDPDPNGEKQCDLLCASLVFDSVEEGYPKEWIFNSEGWPVCTKWQKWDWGNDGNPDDPDNPKAPPPPPDPNQMNLFPLLFRVFQY